MTWKPSHTGCLPQRARREVEAFSRQPEGIVQARLLEPQQVLLGVVSRVFSDHAVRPPPGGGPYVRLQLRQRATW